jgi:NADH-quinone oxidoreductase subunit A
LRGGEAAGPREITNRIDTAYILPYNGQITEPSAFMNQTTEYLGLLVTFLIAGGIASLILILNALLGPKNKSNPAKLEPFECGKDPLMAPTGRFSVKFYLFAMFFILFDVEIVWFFPWATVLKSLGWVGIAQMFGFIGVLLIGFIYAWKKGALEWER